MAVAFAGKAAQAAATAKELAPSRRPKIRQSETAQAPVMTCMIVSMGVGALRTWLVDKESMPPREWWVKMAVLGFGLALATEINSSLGKNTSYLVMAAVITANMEDILKELDVKWDEPVKGKNKGKVRPNGGATPAEGADEPDPSVDRVRPIVRPS